MVGDYGQSVSGLEFRQPARLFVPLGWLAAGMLNPVGYFAYALWGLPEFNYQVWTWHAAAPLELGILFALMFLREGGFGFPAVLLLTILSVAVACAISGPVYALTTWVFQQNGVSLGMLGWVPIDDMNMAIAVSGTYMRTSLLYAGAAAIPAAIIIRLVTLQRIPPKTRAASGNAPARP